MCKDHYNENSEEISVTELGTIKIKINCWYEIYVYLKIPNNQTLSTFVECVTKFDLLTRTDFDQTR